MGLTFDGDVTGGRTYEVERSEGTDEDRFLETSKTKEKLCLSQATHTHMITTLSSNVVMHRPHQLSDKNI